MFSETKLHQPTTFIKEETLHLTTSTNCKDNEVIQVMAIL